MKPYLSAASMAMIGSLKQKMVIYPIERELDKDGLQVINWVANIREAEDSGIKVRDWNRRVGKEKLLRLYKNWIFEWIDIPEMIEKTDGGIFEFPMSDRDPLDRWSFGRVSLLGDAAHPMYPIGSNGASQAILDAEALTISILNNSDPVKALQKYNDERVPATAKVVLQNRQGWFYHGLMVPNGFEQNEIPQEELSKLWSSIKKSPVLTYSL
jgi:2-polyprenyl-6-methoxyphenol hydroxylase-like FAD-dependent oxidoreductase